MPPQMHEPLLFEYAVIRFVPRVEREEFINIGVLVYCAKTKSLAMRYHLDEHRLRAFAPEADIDEVLAYMKAFEKVCAASAEAGPIALLPAAERFRWLAATRSTIVQTSRVHPGYSQDLSGTLQRLFEQLVLL
jgi:Protein of unknown function (DUF3037)